MSVRVMTAVWEIDLPASDKIVLLALADCANDEGLCWPGMATLVGKCSKAERTVQAAIQRLEKGGQLTRNPVPGKGVRYIVHPTKAPPQNLRDTPAKSAPRNSCVLPPQNLRDTPAKSAGKPSKNHQEPSEVKSADADRLTPADILEGWNDLAEKCGLKKAHKMTGGRLRQAKARLREYPAEADWRRALKHIHDTPFLRGQNDRGWSANIDFLLQASSFTKLTEETYGAAH